jgi:site-specific recombinase XerD
MPERGRVYNKIYNEEEWKDVLQENKNIMEDFLEEYKQRKKSPKTVSQYFNDLRIVLLFVKRKLGNRCLFDLNKKDFRKLSLWLTDELDVSNARANRLLSATRSLLTYCEDDDDYDYDNNVARKVHGLEREPVKTNEDDFFMTFEQVMKVREELLKRGDLKLVVLHMLLFDSGGRRNEVYQIKKQNILEGNKTNIVRGKRGKTFPLVYLDDTKELIKQYLEARGEDNIDSLWYIGKGEGKRPASYESIYDWVCCISKVLSEIEGKELNIFPHTYRHSKTESMLQGTDTRVLDENGKPKKFTLEQVQKFLNSV